MALPAVAISVLAGCASAPATSAGQDTGKESIGPTLMEKPVSTGVITGTLVTITPQPLGSASPSHQQIPTGSVDARSCLTGTLAVVYPVTDNPVRSACVHMGTKVTIDLVASHGFVWGTPVASTPAVAAVADRTDSSGTHHDTVTLLHPGFVTFTSGDIFTPDPHGPASESWTLALTVVP